MIQDPCLVTICGAAYHSLAGHAVVLNQGDLPPKGSWQFLEAFVVLTGKGGIPLASSR